MLRELQLRLRKIAFVIPRSLVLTGQRTISGDVTRKATLVPIPNTIVKLAGPMIVPKGVKVGHRRSLSKEPMSN